MLLTKRMQIQAIADRLGGLEPSLRARNMIEPWRACMRALEEAAPGQERYQLLAAVEEAIADEQERSAVLGAIFSTPAGGALGHFPSLQQRYDQGLIPPIEWLWEGWIPVGMLSLLTGEPGAGKSMVALDLANRIIAGKSWPDGAAIPRPGTPVVYVEAEAVPQIHEQRTRWWDADRSKLYLLLPEDELFIDLNEQEWRDRLVEIVATVNPAIVFVDSLSTISLKGENNKEDVVQLLGFLNRVADSFDVGMVLIHHLRKRSGQLSMGLTMDDVRGSGHIVASGRSVMGLSIVQTGPQPDKNGPRRLEILKTNLARYPKPLGCEFVPLEPDGVMLRYGDAPERYEEPTRTDQCADWILTTLDEQGEPMRPKALVELAAEAGFGRSLFYKARDLLEGQIVDTKGRQHPQNEWALPEWGKEG